MTSPLPNMPAATACTTTHCTTCSDEGIPMRVASVDATSGIAWCIDEAGTRSEVMTALVADVREGDLLLVHAATALTRLEAAGVPR